MIDIFCSPGFLARGEYKIRRRDVVGSSLVMGASCERACNATNHACLLAAAVICEIPCLLEYFARQHILGGVKRKYISPFSNESITIVSPEPLTPLLFTEK